MNFYAMIGSQQIALEQRILEGNACTYSYSKNKWEQSLVPVKDLKMSGKS